MRLKYCFILAQLVIFCQNGFCQKNEKDTESEAINYAKVSPSNLALSRFQINDIKARGIIVRLKTDKNRIDAYRTAGNTKVAGQLTERAKLTGMVLEYAFITNWSYCPVYFMESQYTEKLMKQDTLVAKTYDLQRDTNIYMNHDSFYIVDYGQVIANEYSGKKASNPSAESGAPEPGWFLVVKDHDQVQLQNPMPYKAKVWGDGFAATDRLMPIEVSKDLIDSVAGFLNTYADVNELYKSNVKRTVFKYLAAIFDHVNIGETVDSAHLMASSRSKLISKDDQLSEKKIWGDPYTQAALRLNKHFIHYYCERLNKDKNILSREDLLYWWLKNPNIRYLPYLHDIEVGLKKSLDKVETFIPMH